MGPGLNVKLHPVQTLSPPTSSTTSTVIPPLSSSAHQPISLSLLTHMMMHTAHPLSCLIYIVKLFMTVYWLFTGMGGDQVTNFRVSL